MSLSLARALRISQPPIVAFIGAGGKTTAMFQLARDLPPPVIITATSHMGSWQTGQVDHHIITESESIEGLADDLRGVLLITGKMNGVRYAPVNEELLNWLFHYCKSRSIPLLIEADGSRQKPLKAWADHEPPIPAFVNLVVQVAGTSGWGTRLDDEHIHRAGIFSKLSGLEIGETVTPQALARVLLQPQGGLKNIPEGARRVILFNQAEDLEKQSAAGSLAPSLLPVYDSVAVASLINGKIFAVHEPLAGIILAAGKAVRFGAPKQLLDWKGQPFVRAIAQTAVKAGLSPVLVVTGAHAAAVEAVLRDLGVVIVRNNDWESGQGSSIREGVRATTLASISAETRLNVGGAVFLLADQPQVNSSVLRALAEKHAEGLYPIIAPLVHDRRANPVLFDRDTFPDLSSLVGDVGGRAIFHRHRVEYVPWHDDSLLLDVDTPGQYQELLLSGGP